MWPEESELTIWTRPSAGCDTEPAVSVVQAPARIGRHPRHVVAVICDPTGSGSEELGAFVQIAEELGAPRDALSIRTPHPSVAWLNALIDGGLGDLRYSGDLSADRPEPGRVTIAESLDQLCPSLHATRSRGVILSVCGEHTDHMVLSSRQVSHQCTRDFWDCPYRRSESAHSKRTQ